MTSPCAAPDRVRGLSVLDTIGDTPLLRLRRSSAICRGGAVREGRVEESRRVGQGPPGAADDPGGARAGQLAPGKVILDATSGNTGIAYAMIGAAMGYSVTLCVPRERHARTQAHPARLRRGAGLHQSARRIRRRDSRGAQTIRRRIPERTSIADQYNNDFNWRAHYDTTGPEIIRADRRPHHALCRRPRHQRHVRRRRPPAARVQPDDRACVGAAGFAAARPRRAQAHGVGDRAGHLRSELADEDVRRRHRRRLRDDAAPRAGRRPAGRHLERRRTSPAR